MPKVNGPASGSPSSARPLPPDVEISVVLPCYRAGPLAARSARELHSALKRAGFRSWEIVIVDDGGGDVASLLPATPSTRVIALRRNVGKGAAVRIGMLAACGQARIFTDVDLPYGSSAVIEIARLLLAGACDVAIGDRTLAPGPPRVLPGALRRSVSALASMLVRSTLTPGLPDTQCGLKGFSADAARRLFPLLRVRRFAFDIEVLFLARRHALQIARVPVRLINAGPSSVRLTRDLPIALFDVLRIPCRWLLRAYGSAPSGPPADSHDERTQNR